jgi:hypothetical protein
MLSAVTLVSSISMVMLISIILSVVKLYAVRLSVASPVRTLQLICLLGVF